MPQPLPGADVPQEDVQHDYGAKYEEVDIVVSDLHLSEGERVSLIYGGRRGFSRIVRSLLYHVFGVGERSEEVDNWLEEFHYDGEFADFLELISERYRDCGRLRLVFLGDIFDPLTVSWEGQFLDPRYEGAAEAKLQRIITGHPDFFRALSRFVARANCHLDLFVGNHDLFLVWPKVQQALRYVLTGGKAELNDKLRFVDHLRCFRLKERGVLYEHGNRVEPHNYVKPEDTIVTEVLGQKLKHPILNAPYGNYMFVDMVTSLKHSNPLVGSVRSDKRTWNHALRYRWVWGLQTGLKLIWHFIYSHFLAVADIRRKATLRKILDIVAWTTSNQSVDQYAEQLLERNPDSKVVVLGHSHNWRRTSSDNGTYINVGNWSRSYRLEEPAFELTWNRWPRAELAWRSLQHFFLTGEVRFSWQLTKFVGALALIAAMTAFLFGAFDGGAWTFWPLHPVVTKVLVGISLVFLLAAGTFRLFSIEPYIMPDTRFTYGLIRHKPDGSLQADLMEFEPESGTVHECL